VTITATRTKRDKSMGQPVGILRPEVASQNSTSMPCSSLEKSIQKEAAPTPSSRGGAYPAAAACAGIMHHRPRTNICPPPQDLPCSHFLSTRLIKSRIRNNAPGPRRKPSAGSRDSLTRRRERERARSVCQSITTTINNSADSTSARKHMTLLSTSQAMIPASSLPF
jgi:hypothetical protein